MGSNKSDNKIEELIRKVKLRQLEEIKNYAKSMPLNEIVSDECKKILTEFIEKNDISNKGISGLDLSEMIEKLIEVDLAIKKHGPRNS